MAADYDEVVEGRATCAPHVLVTDIRMPPSFNREGIDAAKEVRQRHPGTGVVILSQYDDPEYAVSLLAEGSAGYGYLLKDHIAEGDQLVDAIRAVATGGTALDPAIVDALVRPVTTHGGLTPAEEELLSMVAEGKPIKAIAVARRLPAEAVDAEVEAVFVKLAEGVSAGTQGRCSACDCCTRRSSTAKSRARPCPVLLPGGLAEKLRRDGRHIGETERVVVTVLMSDIRSYSTIAEHADPSQLAGQLNVHRAAMNEAILGENGTVMQFVGDAVMAVFGAPFAQEDHADRAVAAAAGDARQAARHQRAVGGGGPARRSDWASGCPPARRRRRSSGSEERLEYTLVGDTVNMSQRLQQLADGGGDRPVGGDVEGVAIAGDDGRPPSAAGEGTRHSGRRVQTGRRQPAEPVRRRREKALTWMPWSSTRCARHSRRRTPRCGHSAGPTWSSPSGDFVALMGPSGCGKSTLLNLVAGLDVADEGTITVAGELVTGRTEDELSQLRRTHIGIVFQFFNLLEGMTVLENVALPAVIAGRKRRMAETRARDLLDLLGIGDKASTVPGMLSGGQRQRLAIARALANEPTLLLADEPTGALDSEGGQEVIELLSRLHAGGQTIVLVTHDPDVAAAAERIVRMRDGRIVVDGGSQRRPSRCSPEPRSSNRVTVTR